MKDVSVTNAIHIKSLFRYKYLVGDTDELLWKQLCLKHGIDAKVERGHFHKKGTDWSLYLISIPKRYLEEFRKVSEEVTNTRLVMGFNDYVDFCDEVKRLLEEVSDE